MIITKWQCVECESVVDFIPEQQPTTDISGRYRFGLCACHKVTKGSRYATFRAVQIDTMAPKPVTKDAATVSKFLRLFSSEANQRNLRLILDAEPVACWELERATKIKHQTLSAVFTTLAREGFIVSAGYHRTPEGRNAIAYKVVPGLAEWLRTNG